MKKTVFLIGAVLSLLFVSPSSGTYDKSETISLLATPLPGFSFKSWGGDLS